MNNTEFEQNNCHKCKKLKHCGRVKAYREHDVPFSADSNGRCLDIGGVVDDGNQISLFG